jgi:hypothetical protein
VTDPFKAAVEAGQKRYAAKQAEAEAKAQAERAKQAELDRASAVEAVEWVKKSPNPMNAECDVEIRPLYAPETWDPK